jgi:serine/threonine-protein kinase
MPVPVGSLVAGKYEVEGLLGRGGMGVVVAATDVELRRKVAIKFVERQSEQATARFMREARAAAQIDSEHVTRVFEVGRLEQGSPYIVLERLEGQNLAGVIAAGPVPPAEAAGHALEICEALARAHAARIVHRDLKPENLFLHTRRDGSRIIKLLDFGISKSLEFTALTESQAIVGSPQYLAPEQIESPERVDPRTDLWSLGVVLYELVSGERPFRGGSMAELCMNILSGQVPPLAGKVSALPEGFEAVLRRCLTRNMAERYPSVAELARALAPFADPDHARLVAVVERALQQPSPLVNAAEEGTVTPGEPAASTELMAAATPVASTARGPFRRSSTLPQRPRRSMRRMLLSLALVGVAFWVLQSRSTQDGCARLTRTLEAPAPQSSLLVVAPPEPEPAPPVSATAPSSEPPASQAPPEVASAEPPSQTKPGKRPRPAAKPSPSSAPAVASPPPSTAAAASLSPAPVPTPATPPAAVPTSCRVLELTENGKLVQPTTGRIAFEWARRLCTSRAQPGGRPYRLSESGIAVKCVCD